MIIGTVNNASLQIERIDGATILVLRWRPVTGEQVAMCRLPLGPDSLVDLQRGLLQMADQIITEHLDGVHLAVGDMEDWLRNL